jgi:ribosomal subunit interface protein
MEAAASRSSRQQSAAAQPGRAERPGDVGRFRGPHVQQETAMQLIISGRGVVLTRQFKDSVSDKIAKLAPLLPALIEARATFSAEKFRRTVRLTLTAKRRVFSSTATAGELTVAVDEAIAGLAHQVRRAKDRRRLAPRRLTRAARRRPAGEVA